MNLAEIRKKAQKEKSLSVPVATPGRLQVDRELSDVVHSPDQPTARQPASADGQEAPPCGEPFLPEEFDPVAILMAGRRDADSDGVSMPMDGGRISVDQDTSQKYLCFRIGDEEYAVNLMDIKEIIKPREITEVPHVPDFVKGIISLRGMVLPIFDMRMRLGFPETPQTGRERFVIVKNGEGFCGLLVDEVYHVISLARKPIERPPAVLEGKDRAFVSGIGRHGDRIFILMDLEKVLDILLQ